MIFGSQIPHFLRPAVAEGKHMLMGETYLNGCMQDKMVPEELEKRIGPV
jgi:hypothetical protein